MLGKYEVHLCKLQVTVSYFRRNLVDLSHTNSNKTAEDREKSLEGN